MTKLRPNSGFLDKISRQATTWVGTPWSIVVHTFLFIGIFSLRFFGFTIDAILLILTTLVSLEAIYMSIFIQMTVNRNTESLEEVEEDIGELQEDVEGIEKDVDELQEDIEDIQEEDLADDKEEAKTRESLEAIEDDLRKLLTEIDNLKRKNLHT